jgi:PhnB protein
MSNATNAASASTTVIQPYLFFGGRCEEALAFYKSALGAQVDMVMHFNDSPDPVPAGMLQPGFEKKVMHSSFRVGGTTVMASDGCSPSDGASHSGFSLTLSVATEAEADRAFSRLAEGGKVTMPLGKTFFSPRYGMLTDKFGIAWMVLVPQAMPQ